MKLREDLTYIKCATPFFDRKDVGVEDKDYLTCASSLTLSIFGRGQMGAWERDAKVQSPTSQQFWYDRKFWDKFYKEGIM